MKKSIVLLLLLLICMLAGCTGLLGNKTVKDNNVVPKSNGQADAYLSIKIPFEADESIIGDPPEGAPSVFKAQKQLAIILADTEDPILWKTPKLLFIYRGIETKQDANEYYRIDLCTKDEASGAPAVLRSYLAGMNNTFQRQSDNGEWTFIVISNPKSASADKDKIVAEWWGNFRSGDITFSSYNYNGKSYRFLFYGDDISEFDGVAAVYVDNKFQAEYMDMVFTLSEDMQIVTVTQVEDRQDKEERDQFIGQYYRE